MSERARSKGYAYITLDAGHTLDGRTIHFHGKTAINFASCSYLGLEIDPRLKEAAKRAIDTYGVQYSMSRCFTHLDLYDEIEELLQQVTGKPCLYHPTVTLGHLATLPHIVESSTDIVLIDQQVHGSVQLTAAVLSAQKVKIVPFLNSHLEKLTAMVEKYSVEYERVHVFIDGLYSMFGTIAPAVFYSEMTKKYPKLRMYVDDAHGIGVFGQKGEGSYLAKVGNHDRLVVAGSTSKGLGAEGGVVAYDSEDQKRWVLNTGCFFVGPAHPATMAALRESLLILLSEELGVIQNSLQRKIGFFNETCAWLGLPLLSANESPIKFIGVKYEDIGSELLERLIQKGYYINGCSYPNVPLGRAGLRITISDHIQVEDIQNLLATLKIEMDTLMAQKKRRYEDVFEAFKIR